MSNPFLVGLVERLDNRYSVDRLGMTMSSWMEANTLLLKRPFSFAEYEFQRAIADDLFPQLEVKKVSQVGMTEVQIRKALALCVRNNGLKGIFTMPNEKMFKRISKTRLQPIIEANPVFNPEGSDRWTRSMDLKQFDQSFLYVTGATEGDATSIDADFVFNDEVDLTDQSMLALFQSRMQNSKHRISQRFSTPTHVGFGIDKSYGASDQREYMCRCYACNHYNIPDFTREFVIIPGLPDHIEDLSHIDEKLVTELDLKGAEIVCERCHAPLDLDNPDIREWVPRYPERSDLRHGYFVRPFVTSRLDVSYVVKQLLEYKQKDFVRGWHNTVVGKAYTDKNSRLSEVDIRANFFHPAPIAIEKGEDVIVGIDVGLVSHILVGKITAAGSVICEFLTKPADELPAWASDLAASHNLVCGAMDRYPYTPTAKAVFEASGGKIFPVEYRGAREIAPIENETHDVVYYQANRTSLIDAVVRQIRKHQFPMAGYGDFDHTVIEHFRDMIRDEQPEKEAVWVKLTGNDHYFHAAGFFQFALRILSYIENTGEEDTRTMMGLIGVDTQSVGTALYRENKKRRALMYGR